MNKAPTLTLGMVSARLGGLKNHFFENGGLKILAISRDISQLGDFGSHIFGLGFRDFLFAFATCLRAYLKVSDCILKETVAYLREVLLEMCLFIKEIIST